MHSNREIQTSAVVIPTHPRPGLSANTACKQKIYGPLALSHLPISSLLLETTPTDRIQYFQTTSSRRTQTSLTTGTVVSNHNGKPDNLSQTMVPQPLARHSIDSARFPSCPLPVFATLLTAAYKQTLLSSDSTLLLAIQTQSWTHKINRPPQTTRKHSPSSTSADLVAFPSRTWAIYYAHVDRTLRWLRLRLWNRTLAVIVRISLPSKQTHCSNGYSLHMAQQLPQNPSTKAPDFTV